MTELGEMTTYVALLVAATVAHHISCTPPRAARESSDHLLRLKNEQNDKVNTDVHKELLHGGQRWNQFGMIGVASSKYVVWIIAALEITSRILSLFPTTSLSRAILPILLPTPHPELSVLPVPAPARPQNFLLSTLSPAFLLSVLSIFIGFLIRRSCFAAMGRHFSFTHTTIKGHQLIKTGPYGVVRHPSYTGEILVRFGVVALLLAPGGFVRTSGAMSFYTGFFGSLDPLQKILLALVRGCVAFYIGWVSFGCTYLILRAPLEDATLRETFGKEWDSYAKEVPYRFVPCIA